MSKIVRRLGVLAGTFVLAVESHSFAQEPAEDDLEIPAAPAEALSAPPAPPTVSPAEPAAPGSDDGASESPATGDDDARAAEEEQAPPPVTAPAPSVPPDSEGATPPNAPSQAPVAATSSEPASAAPDIAASDSAAPDSHVRGEAAPERRSERSMGLQTGNLELTAYSRPVPLGLLLSGFVQAEYLSSQISEDQLEPSGDPRNRDGLSLRSARLRVDAGYPNAACTIELDASTQSGPLVGIRRAEGALLYRGFDEQGQLASQGPPLIALSAGLTDVPFGYEVVESSRTRLFLERTLGSEALYPTQMDLGVKLSGAFRFLRYAIGVFNGEPVLPGRSVRDPNASKDVVARFGVDTELGEGVGLSGGTSFSFGKGFHAGRLATKDQVAWRDDNDDGVAAPSEITGVPGSSPTPSRNYERWAIALDLQLAWRSALGYTRLGLEGFVASNHDRGFLPSDPIDVGFDVRQSGGYASLTQDLSPHAVVGFRAATYDPDSDWFEQRRGQFVPASKSVTSLSPLAGLILPGRARLVAQYDFLIDRLGRDERGVPRDSENHQFGLRLQVDL